ncbi:WYL domain-containing protein [Amycolatopsis rhabdoformis]|uniref:WYL domain-containing protein n=1 Tax=Amycolatopsis rhabdoformis TaxID=1448059 RepID=A0ABZ1IAQ0_9PSEU|nr:WYL domain-containing protein [Amycolatopsis rhabdoformis]WSE31531.1 WYL domain-containing protein [Amycolatopsis rhabdoformis]
MVNASARLLRLASLLSTRPTWTNGELAERLAVTPRTVRRDVAKLRELGYGIESDPGPWGGYRLGPGTALPPLSLDDEEALAVAVALREAALSGVLGSDHAALSALLKLRRLLPRRVAERLGAFDEAFVHTPRSSADPVPPAILLELATACRRGERLRLSYRDLQSRTTVRDIDPYRLVRTAHRWYLVALDSERGRWRTFRVDRMTDVHPTGRPARLPDTPDAAALVATMLTSHYPVYTTLRLEVPLAEAERLVPPGSGVHEALEPAVTRVKIGGTDVESLALRLVRIGAPFRVESPAEVRDAVRRLLREMLDATS